MREIIEAIGSGLVKVNSENPPGRESDAARYFAEKAAELGLRARVIDHGGGRASALVELIFGEGPVLVFNSHLDTVPVGPVERWSFHPLSTGVSGGYLCGRGSVDAKGALAAMLAAVSTLRFEGLMGRVVLMAVADEEVSGLGSLSLIKLMDHVDYMVVGEPTSLKICVASRGRTEVTVNFYGKPTHASKPLEGVNAVSAAARACVKLARLERGYGKRHRYLGRSSAAVTLIRGGLKPNIIPDSSNIVIDIRTTVEKPAETLRMVKQIIKPALPKQAFFKAAISSHIPPYMASLGGALVRACQQACRAAGVKPVLTGFEAATDLNRIQKIRPVEGVIIGPGDLRLAHSFRERVAVKELVKAAEIYKTVAEHLLSTSHP
ncbi:MAG: M20 family metallopeptidase [Candidatus Caldarchaeum sp.]